ncbi:DUF3010 family protein [Ferrimonas marina]|uniref:DUF3010 domain-containing protein n=1 Tax=Ferrimonas marina TaxID=299255 RepID=A0A1M5YDQ4_9GAMM|nr:DUF3010 family protein [Ferrimonas marina]SHI10165.1 Protein of unknown function [Ferrimonas marina]
MRICGVELKGSEAVLCLLDYKVESFYLPDCRQRSIACSGNETVEGMRQFHFAFHKLMADYQVDEIVIIQRAQKGKFAGGAPGFKMEAAIQLGELPVSLISNTQIKEQLKRNPPLADFADMGMKKFQQPAFNAAYCAHNLRIFGKSDD